MLPRCCSEFTLHVLSLLQVAQLGQLAELRLDDCNYDATDLAPLSRLASSLTGLAVTGGRLPPCLSALGRLQRLDARYCELGEEAAGVLSGALQRLTRLTQLVSGAALCWHVCRVGKEPACMWPQTFQARGRPKHTTLMAVTRVIAWPQVLHGCGLTPPAALAGLSHLRRCYLSRTDRPAVGAAAALQLPVGPWLHNLQWLGINVGLLAGSVAALGAAPALEFVELVESDSSQQLDWQRAPGAAAFFDWLAQHPPLARVSFESRYLTRKSLFNSPAFAMRLLQLGRSRPSLRVRCSGGGGGDFPESMRMSLASE